MIKTNQTNETKFSKENLIKDGMYLLFGASRKFVARFKYRGTPFSMAKFRKELIANHTPASYFKAMSSGKSPLRILEEANPIWSEKIMADFVQNIAGYRPKLNS
jgi:hypothetical protein